MSAPGKLNLGDAKLSMRRAWERNPSLDLCLLSKRDSYTDGFFGGRLWALARLVELGLVDFDKAVEALEVCERDAKALREGGG